MINKILEMGFELYIFIAIEILIVITYFSFFKYSRTHGGVFDRRTSERRSNTQSRDRRIIDPDFKEAYAIGLTSNDFFNSEQDRRIKQRRFTADRRSI